MKTNIFIKTDQVLTPRPEQMLLTHLVYELHLNKNVTYFKKQGFFNIG